MYSMHNCYYTFTNPNETNYTCDKDKHSISVALSHHCSPVGTCCYVYKASQPLPGKPTAWQQCHDPTRGGTVAQVLACLPYPHIKYKIYHIDLTECGVVDAVCLVVVLLSRINTKVENKYNDPWHMSRFSC